MHLPTYVHLPTFVLTRPLVELVPPTGEEHTVELQVHQRSSIAGGIAPANTALASATPTQAHQHGAPASACATPGASCTSLYGTPHGKLADGSSCAELTSFDKRHQRWGGATPAEMRNTAVMLHEMRP